MQYLNVQKADRLQGVGRKYIDGLHTDAVLDKQVSHVRTIAGRLVGDIDLK